MEAYDMDFWDALDQLTADSEIVIDRPKGSAHPRFPNFIYPVDYGYLKGTASMDGGGIDVWLGTGERKLDAVMCIVDRHISDPQRNAVYERRSDPKIRFKGRLSDDSRPFPLQFPAVVI